MTQNKQIEGLTKELVKIEKDIFDHSNKLQEKLDKKEITPKQFVEEIIRFKSEKLSDVISSYVDAHVKYILQTNQLTQTKQTIPTR